MIDKKELRVLSSDGVHKLSVVVYLPEGKARGMFQVVHGMTEHIERYADFMSDMAKAGYVCFGHDHLGHGNTANDDTELGYIAKKNGWDYLARDVSVVYDSVKKECLAASLATASVVAAGLGESLGDYAALSLAAELKGETV